MTTAGQQEGGDDTVQIKRVRMDHAELPSSSNDQQRLTTAAGSAAADVSLVAVPLVGDQMAGSDLVPALQQLLSVYQVEYWALLEELRATHSTVAQAGAAAAAPVTGGSGGRSMQQLWQASVAASSDAQKHQGEAAGRAAGQADKQQQEPALTSPFAAAAQPYGDQRCGFATESCDQDPSQPQRQQLLLPSLDQAEALLQQLAAGGRDAGAADQQQLQEWRQRWNAVSPSVAGLEQLASAASMQYMDAQGGLACLCGQHGRWVLRRSAVSLGRSTDAKGDVDVDLGKAAGEAGLGGRVSRLQAQLLLTADGAWSVTNTGRAPLAVNGKQVPRGSTVSLPHLSLLEVCGLPLLFMVNSMAVQRAVNRSVHLAM